MVSQGAAARGSGSVPLKLSRGRWRGGRCRGEQRRERRRSRSACPSEERVREGGSESASVTETREGGQRRGLWGEGGYDVTR